MALVFDDRGLLSPGVHGVSMADVMEHFGGFQRTDRRPKLFAKLEKYLDELSRAGIGGSVVIDGSFVMAGIDEPEDIDIVLVLPAGWNTDADLQPYQYNLVSKRVVKKTIGFDMFVVEAGSTKETKWIRYFGQVNTKWSDLFGWPNDLRKGLLRITL